MSSVILMLSVSATEMVTRMAQTKGQMLSMVPAMASSMA
jgi:hypothetical protein